MGRSVAIYPVCHPSYERRLAERNKGYDATVAAAETAALLSRATDEQGARQPTREELIALRGSTMSYRYNAIHGWKVHADGKVARQWDS